MFSSLKDKYWGKEVWAFDAGIDSRGRTAKVIIWERDGSYKLHIKSHNYSYVQAGSSSWGKVKFETPMVESLVRAVNEASLELRRLTQPGRV